MTQANENTTPQATKQRIEYIDALRGFTMILVVYSHIVNTVFRAASPSNDLFIAVRMPLFFFVSGFFAYAVYTKSLVLKRIKNRIFKQLLPTIVMFSAFCLLFGFNYKYNIMHQSKRGYWFTLVAVEYFFTYMGINGLSTLLGRLTRVKRNVWLAVFMVISVALGQWLYYSIREVDPAINSWVNAFSLKLYSLYLPYFFMGIAARMWLKGFDRILQNKYLVAAIIIAFISAYIGYNKTSSHVIGTVCSVLGVVAVFKVFEHYKEFMSSRTRIGKALTTIGRYTLEIYLLHYFVIRGLIGLRNAPAFVYINAAWFAQLVVYMILAIVVVYACLLFAKIMKVSPIIYAIMFGKTQ